MADHWTGDLAKEYCSPPKKKKRLVLNETITLDNNQRSPLAKSVSPLSSRKSPRLQRKTLHLIDNLEQNQQQIASTNKNSFADQNSSRIIGSIPENEKINNDSSFAREKTSEDKLSSNSASKVERKERRKSKRRSSFVSGRISKPFLAAENNKISQDLPMNLSQDVRLEMLYRKSLEHTMNKLQEELPDLPQLESFRVQVLDAAESQITELRERGEFIKATTPSEKLLQSVESQRLEETIRVADEHIKRYDNEIAMWDRILEDHKNAADEAESDRISVEENPLQLTGVPENLSEEHKLLLSSRPNAIELRTKLQGIHHKQVFAMDAINRHIKRHTKTYHQAKKLVEEQSSHIAAASFPSLVGKSPRRLIQNIIHQHEDVPSKEHENDRIS